MIFHIVLHAISHRNRTYTSMTISIFIMTPTVARFAQESLADVRLFDGLDKVGNSA